MSRSPRSAPSAPLPGELGSATRTAGRRAFIWPGLLRRQRSWRRGFRGRILIASWMSMQSIVSRERSHLHDAGERRPSLNTGVTGSLMGWPGGRSRRRAHATTPSWRTAGEGSPVVAAFRAVAASGWRWAQAPVRSAASPAPARWPAAAARTAVPRPARGCCPGPSGDPECGCTVRGPAGWGSPGPDGPRRGADPQPVQLLVDQDIPVRAGEAFRQLPYLILWPAPRHQPKMPRPRLGGGTVSIRRTSMAVRGLRAPSLLPVGKRSRRTRPSGRRAQSGPTPPRPLPQLTGPAPGPR